MIGVRLQAFALAAAVFVVVALLAYGFCWAALSFAAWRWVEPNFHLLRVLLVCAVTLAGCFACSKEAVL